MCMTAAQNDHEMEKGQMKKAAYGLDASAGRDLMAMATQRREDEGSDGESLTGNPDIPQERPRKTPGTARESLALIS